MRKWFWLAALWTVFVTILCLVSFSDLPSVSVSNADKYVHTFIHFVFTILWATFLSSQSGKKTVKQHLFKVVLWSFLFGSAIEVAQHFFTETRQADIRDVAANIVGSLIGAVLFWVIHAYILKPNQKL